MQIRSKKNSKRTFIPSGKGTRPQQAQLNGKNHQNGKPDRKRHMKHC